MPTECSAELFEFAAVKRRSVVAGFDGGAITSDAGALLLGATDRAIGLMGRFAACFLDRRRPGQVEHAVRTLVGQRVFGIALGYEDINDHDELRHDPVMAELAGKLEARRKDCAPMAGKSTLNRLELSRDVATRYHKIAYDRAAIEELFVMLFLEAHASAPQEIILDLDATVIRCMAIRRGGSSTAIMIATAICRCMCSAAGICWRRSCAPPILTARQVRWRRSRGLSHRSVRAGRRHALFCAPTRALRATR